MHRWWGLIGAGGVGLLMGWLCADVVLVNSAWALVPWAMVGLVIGALSPARPAVLAGAAYGLVLAFSFMAFSYDGASSLVSVLLLFTVLGLVGAACGAVLAGLASTVRSRQLR